jgi:hypothetical protein
MHLNTNQALQMTIKNVDGSNYLFIEAGGFNTKNGPGWKPSLVVFQRVQP